MKIHIYADGANLSDVLAAYRGGLVRGFTTNPTLMRKAGVTDYAAFGRELVRLVPDMPISFEVFADDFEQMEAQARLIAWWGAWVYVKIPITNTRGESSCPLIRRLVDSGIKLNVTAILTLEQVRAVDAALSQEVPAIVSVFAGRIADTGRDPAPIMRAAAELLRSGSGAFLLWASPREVLNVYQAEACGCDIITLSPELIGKLALQGKDLNTLSLDTVKMFYDDAVSAGFELFEDESGKPLGACVDSPPGDVGGRCK